MKRMRSLGVLLLLAGLLTAPFGNADELPAIGQLETREYLIIVHVSRDGPLYTIKTHDETVVEAHLTEQLLATLFPELYETLRWAIAEFSE
ncbi:MAG: hypothetical protein O7C67_00910 [Gammaproteobacteria bacterium]|nr:hypothetical protein [Gammaproteobacteria bacterium]